MPRGAAQNLDFPFVGPQQTGKDAKRRGLARSIRPEVQADGGFGDAEAQMVQDAVFSVPFAEPRDFDGFGHAPSLGRSAASGYDPPSLVTMGERQGFGGRSTLGGVRLTRPFQADTFQADTLPRTVSLFAGLSLMTAFFRSLVKLPSYLSVGEASFSLGVPLPLYSLLAVAERGVTVIAAFGLVVWLVRPGKRSGLECAVGIGAALPLLVQLARLSDGTSALLLVVVVLRRWFPVTLVGGFALMVLVGISALGGLPVGEWKIFGLSFSVTEPSSLEELLTAAFRSASYLSFALFALELGIRLSQEREVLQQTLVKLEEAQEQERRLLVLEERTALSRELHDTIGHHMTAMNLYAQRAELLAEQEKVSSALQESLSQVRRQGLSAIQGLTQAVSTLRDEGQIQQHRVSLFAQVTALCQQWPAPVTLETVGQDCLLSDELMLTAHRFCQEALTNASKHASGQVLRLLVEVGPQTLKIEAVNPLSVNPSRLPTKSGYGLRGLRERAVGQGGTLETSKQKGVFRLCLTLPLPLN